MNPIFTLRLVLDGIAVGLLLFAFSYHWLGNASHELAGIGMFMLLVVHNLFHRRWFSTLSTSGRARRGGFNLALTAVLLAGMLALLASSLVISETLFAGLRMDDDFTARQVHAGIAYWLLIIVAIHLGLRWPMLMAVGRNLFGIEGTHVMRSVLFRSMAIAVAVQGLCSIVALNLHDRLLFRVSLDWWNFEESAVAFFGHCLAIVGLCVFATYYATHWRARRRRRAAG